ncbi:uncharacterized protein VDAG_02591 [Verticillium dahliae VdLs.17]|uniref:Rhodopsin domain-containing protein n=2 Tax=Verticillium dahliae TaxID=27337 RepID=G2WYA9_VERDV|nr:uncharacterized protein VDAG_02591 [Verticillium dahliae VdLs.17]EGY21067.1 hypothetical protein VDAG_02591 [Verticillium dahliae VdLs.17]KAH6707039.1 hypothetical protein EV126DRAFT_439327 [Verticillium dahliae]
MDESNDINITYPERLEVMMVSGDPAAMSTPNTKTSAFYGQPPNTVRDANIVQGTFWVDFKLNTLDPNGGIPFAPVPPPGYEHEDKQAAIIVGMVLVILAITVPTVARIVARFRSTEMRLGLDDYTIVLAASLATVYPCFQIWMVVSAGGGRHSWENTYEDWEKFVRGLSSCRLLFFVTVGLIKISITLFVRRLTDRASVFWRLAADVFLGSLVVYVLAALFWNSFFCLPPRAWFSRQYAGSLARPPRCSDDVTNARVFSIIHTIQSFLLLGAPIIIMWHVRIDASKKRRLFAIWICGAVTVLGGVLQQIAFVITNDLFWQYTSILRWTTLDLAMGCITASLPVLDAYIMGTWHSATSALGGSSGERSGSRFRTAGSHAASQRMPTLVAQGQVKSDSDSTRNIFVGNRGSDDEGYQLSDVKSTKGGRVQVSQIV